MNYRKKEEHSVCDVFEEFLKPFTETQIRMDLMQHTESECAYEVLMNLVEQIIDPKVSRLWLRKVATHPTLSQLLIMAQSKASSQRASEKLCVPEEEIHRLAAQILAKYRLCCLHIHNIDQQGGTT